MRDEEGGGEFDSSPTTMVSFGSSSKKHFGCVLSR